VFSTDGGLVVVVPRNVLSFIALPSLVPPRRLSANIRCICHLSCGDFGNTLRLSVTTVDKTEVERVARFFTSH